MSPKFCYCINPACSRPDHPDNNNPSTRSCVSCGSQLLLNGQFRVSRLLSDDSGFGNVYEVFQGFSTKILKVLKPKWNSEPQAIELFQQEYTILRELSNQGITAIPRAEDYFEYSTKGGLKLYCLVMERVEGIDLIQWLKNNGKLNQTQAVKWLREIVLILDKVHQKNYFHRDIKPPNIMMRNNGELVLIDFGTAREKTQTYYQKLQGRKVTGILSPGYTPIEQQNGEAVAQSDFFALGRTFVHLFTGKHPCVIYDPMRDVLNWRGDTENINPLLLDLIEGLMARLAADRPQNTQVILQRLDRLEQNLKQPQNPVRPTIQSPAPPKPQPQNHVVRTPSPVRPKPESQNHWIRNSLITVGSITLLGLGIVSLRPSGIDTTKLTPIQPTNAQNISLAQTFSPYFTFFNSLSEVVFSPDSKVLASVSRNKIKLWDVATGRVINSLSDHSDYVTSIAFSPDGKVLASGSWDQNLASGSWNHTIKFWEVKTGRVINTLSGLSDFVSSIAFSPDGKVLASASINENTIKLWDVATGRVINSLSGPSASSVAFSPDGEVLASGNHNNTIKLWDVATGRVINTLSGHFTGVSSVAFSRDGKVLASGSSDSTQTIKLWDVATGRLINSLSDHSGRVNSVAFSPDSKVLASGSSDRNIELWEVKTGRLINTLSSDSGSVAFSPDGKVLASISGDKIELWKVGK